MEGRVARVSRPSVAGLGAGSYERYWDEYRPSAFKVRTATSVPRVARRVGPVGLGLLLVALGVPLVAAIRARRRTPVPAAAGAYVAFLAHAAVDWDWQLPALTLAALFCGIGLLPRHLRLAAEARCGRSAPAPLRAALGCRAAWRAGVCRAAREPGDRGEPGAAARAQWGRASARDARAARFWAPWSTTPLAAARGGAGRPREQAAARRASATRWRRTGRTGRSG